MNCAANFHCKINGKEREGEIKERRQEGSTSEQTRFNIDTRCAVAVPSVSLPTRTGFCRSNLRDLKASTRKPLEQL